MILSEQTQTSQRAQLRKKIEDTIRQIKRFHSFCANLGHHVLEQLGIWDEERGRLGECEDLQVLFGHEYPSNPAIVALLKRLDAESRLLAPHIRKELQKRLEKGEGQVEHA